MAAAQSFNVRVTATSLKFSALKATKATTQGLQS
jgi:hypothetical protein